MQTDTKNTKEFGFTATGHMGEYDFSIAGSIEVQRGCNPYAIIRAHLLDDSMYDRVSNIKAAPQLKRNP